MFSLLSEVPTLAELWGERNANCSRSSETLPLKFWDGTTLEEMFNVFLDPYGIIGMDDFPGSTPVQINREVKRAEAIQMKSVKGRVTIGSTAPKVKG